MDSFDVLALLRDRLRSAPSPDSGGDGFASEPASTGAPHAPDRSPAIAASDGAENTRRGTHLDDRFHHAAQRGEESARVAMIDGRRPFPDVLRDVADAERHARPGDIVAVEGIDPHPAHGPVTADTAATDGGRRLVEYLRRHRPDLTLWALPRNEATPAGLLVIGDLDPGNRTLALAFGETGAEPLSGHQDSAPPDASDDAAFTTVDAMLASLPDPNGVHQQPPIDGHAGPFAPAANAGWRRAEQRCIRAYYEGRHAEGLRACDAVLSSPDAPPEIRNQTLRNATFYAPTFASLVSVFDHRRIDLALPPGWFPTNPSIAASDEGYLAIVRAVDYEIIGPHQYRFADPQGPAHTVNHLVRLDSDLRVIAAYPAVDATLVQPRQPCEFAGLEDCRLVRWRGGWAASCGTVDRTPRCVGMIDLVYLDPATGAFHSAVPLSDRMAMRWEKNWMPVVSGDDLLFVYGCDPVTVLRFDPDGGAVVPHRQHAAPPIARELKGGSQGLRVDGGWLFCVHQSADFPDRNRCYLHRFMLLDDEFRMTHLTRPFTFLAPGIEFCAGIARRGDELVASFGVEDREAHLVRTSLADVLALLEPIARDS